VSSEPNSTASRRSQAGSARISGTRRRAAELAALSQVGCAPEVRGLAAQLVLLFREGESHLDSGGRAHAGDDVAEDSTSLPDRYARAAADAATNCRRLRCSISSASFVSRWFCS
jgi:hypothetical protein